MKKSVILFIAVACLSCTRKEVQNTAASLPVPDSATVNVGGTQEVPDFSESEKELVELLQKTSGLDTPANDYGQHNRSFSDTLVSFIKNNEKTLYYPFGLLQKEHVYIVTSSDRQLRMYSWDNQQGGTMRFFDQLFQFRSNGKVYTREHLASEDAQAFISNIYTVQNKDGHPVYLALSNSVLSSKYVAQHITAYEIKDGSLNETKVFKTRKDLLSSISVEFDFGSVAQRPERPVEVITLSGNLLKIALVDKALNVTNQNLIYEWDGSAFHYRGVK